MKNRYCRRTKLSEPEFLMILTGFCLFETATETQKKINGARQKYGVQISRQTIEKKFLDLGEYLYQRYAKPQLLKVHLAWHPEMDLTDEQRIKACLDDTWALFRGEADYAARRQQNLTSYVTTNVLGALRVRWDKFKGFGESTFTSHLGFASFYDAIMVQETPSVQKSIFWLMKQLEKDPL